LSPMKSLVISQFEMIAELQRHHANGIARGRSGKGIGSVDRPAVPTVPCARSLWTRWTPDRSDFMPTNSKTPLNKNEIAAISWWISQGAPKNALVGSLQLTAEASSAIQAVIGVAGDGVGEDEEAAGPDEAPLPQVAEADKSAVAKVGLGGRALQHRSIKFRRAPGHWPHASHRDDLARCSRLRNKSLAAVRALLGR
jgi:hypothetical protein